LPRDAGRAVPEGAKRAAGQAKTRVGSPGCKRRWKTVPLRRSDILAAAV